MKKLFYIACFFMPQLVWAQDVEVVAGSITDNTLKTVSAFTYCKTNPNIIIDKTRKYETYNPETNRLESQKGTITGLLLHGEASEKSLDGKLWIKTSYYYGLPDRKFEQWDENGKLVKSFVYDKGTGKHGWEKYRNGDVGKWENGIADAGAIYSLYTGDQISNRISYTTKTEGTIEYFFPTGQLKIKGIFKNGDPNYLHGPFEEYRLNGNYKTRGNFKENCYDGTWKNYSEAGQVESTSVYEAVIEYYDNGTIKSKGMMTKNRWDKPVKHGLWEWYYANGALQKEEGYQYGEIQSLQEYDEQGGVTGYFGVTDHKMIRLSNLANGEFVIGSIKKVYDSGSHVVLFSEEAVAEGIYTEELRMKVKEYHPSSDKLKYEYTREIIPGPKKELLIFFGEYALYDPFTQKPTMQGNYSDNGCKIGEWNFYLADGTVKTFKFRDKTTKYPNGKPKLVGSEVYNKETGKWLKEDIWIQFDEQGKWQATYKYAEGKLVYSEPEQ